MVPQLCKIHVARQVPVSRPIDPVLPLVLFVQLLDVVDLELEGGGGRDNLWRGKMIGR